MRDYLTLSWARFSKDVQSHSLQISKILSHPAPRAGDLIKLDASATIKSDSASAGGPDTSLEVIARFPGGLDFGRGLVDINFTMWPLFKALNIDNILTVCEVMVVSYQEAMELTLWADCSGTNRENSIPFSLSFHAWGAFIFWSASLTLSPFSGYRRLLWRRSSISLNSVVGMVSRCRQYILVTLRSTSMILARGFWVSRLRRGIAFVRLPRSAYAICESLLRLYLQRYLTI